MLSGLIQATHLCTISVRFTSLRQELQCTLWILGIVRYADVHLLLCRQSFELRGMYRTG